MLQPGYNPVPVSGDDCVKTAGRELSHHPIFGTRNFFEEWVYPVGMLFAVFSQEEYRYSLQYVVFRQVVMQNETEGFEIVRGFCDSVFSA